MRIGRAAALALAVTAGTLLVGASPRVRDGRAIIPAGTALLSEDGPGQPGARVRVATFRIDRHEVTNAQFAAFVAATGHVTQAEREGMAPVFVLPSKPISLDDPRGWWRMVRGADWRHPQGPAGGIVGHGDDPVVQVSFEDAAAYARWTGGALPTVAQWERAARGDQTAERSIASWITSALHRPIANTWQGVFPLVDTGDDGHAGLAPVGSYPANAFGLVDMIGNAWEWTGDDGGDGKRVLKGGSFLCAANYCANYRPAAWQAQEHDLGASHIGFRTVSAGEGGDRDGGDRIATRSRPVNE